MVSWFRIDKTRRGYHVIIHYPFRFLPAEQVALQAILGSDRRRESLNLMRALSLARYPSRIRAKEWNILFRAKLRLKTVYGDA
jgi:hypothetical protein